MKREYDIGTVEGVSFFFGKEVENTQAKGRDTLFVSNIDDASNILETAIKMRSFDHIYYGANQVFHKQKFDAATFDLFYQHAKALIPNVVFTIDVPHSQLHLIPDDLDAIVTVSIPVQNIKRYKNINFKIDDVDFAASNPGVWVFDVSELPEQCFNDWSVYRGDSLQ